MRSTSVQSVYVVFSTAASISLAHASCSGRSLLRRAASSDSKRAIATIVPSFLSNARRTPSSPNLAKLHAKRRFSVPVHPTWGWLAAGARVVAKVRAFPHPLQCGHLAHLAQEQYANHPWLGAGGWSPLGDEERVSLPLVQVEVGDLQPSRRGVATQSDGERTCYANPAMRTSATTSESTVPHCLLLMSELIWSR